MQRLEEGETGGVIVFDLARFSRRPAEGERLIVAAERGLIVLDSEGEYDLTSASGKKAFRDQMATAAYESDRLSTRVRRGKRLAAVSGGSRPARRPFGFEADGRTLREDEAAVVRELTARVLAGESQDEMIVDLNARGITTSTGGQWTHIGLRQMLTRPRNAGLVDHLGEIVGRMTGTPGEPYEPIVLEETYRRVAALYASRRRGRPAVYLCSGVIACGRCQHMLTGRPLGTAYPDGEVRREYWCQPRPVDGGCGQISIDQRQLDRHVRAMVIKILGDPQHAAAVEAAARATQDARERLEAEVVECEQLVEFLDGRLARREITRERYARIVAPIEAQIGELLAQIAALAAEPVSGSAGATSAEDVAASRAEWGRRWDDATVTERRALIQRALRGRRLLVMPVGKAAGPFNPDRIVIDPSDARPGPARTDR